MTAMLEAYVPLYSSPPTIPASTYIAGTVMQNAAGVLWEVYSDEQDHERKWRRFVVAERHQTTEPGIAPALPGSVPHVSDVPSESTHEPQEGTP